jgi:rhomboid family GlyGly-CTERM serine protease
MNTQLQKISHIVLILLPAMLVATFPQSMYRLQYDRIAITHGACWQLLTQHFCHWSADHLFYDALALVVLGMWAAQYSIKQLWLTLLASCITISAGLYLWQPDLLYARGLSGIDCALLGMVLYHVMYQARQEHDNLWQAIAGVSMVLFACKTAYEMITQQTLFMNSQQAQIIALPLAHLIGFITGLLLAWITTHKRPVPHHQGRARWRRVSASSCHPV